ncbi:MAG: hypothetical protein AAF950_13955 [Pseudomonadota bacterium]
MAFLKVRNLDRDIDEHINPQYISRIRDTQSRGEKKCTIAFSSGETLTALGTADDVIASITDMKT